MEFAFLVVIYLVVIVGSLVMMIVSLVDIVRRPEWQWKLAGQEKVLWLLLVILVNILAITSLIYWFSIRKKLMVGRGRRGRRAVRARSHDLWGMGAGSSHHDSLPRVCPSGLATRPERAIPVPLVGRGAMDRAHLERGSRRSPYERARRPSRLGAGLRHLRIRRRAGSPSLPRPDIRWSRKPG